MKQEYKRRTFDVKLIDKFRATVNGKEVRIPVMFKYKSQEEKTKIAIEVFIRSHDQSGETAYSRYLLAGRERAKAWRKKNKDKIKSYREKKRNHYRKYNKKYMKLYRLRLKEQAMKGILS